MVLNAVLVVQPISFLLAIAWGVKIGKPAGNGSPQSWIAIALSVGALIYLGITSDPAYFVIIALYPVTYLGLRIGARVRQRRTTVDRISS